jgi:hypothetical protein
VSEGVGLQRAAITLQEGDVVRTGDGLVRTVLGPPTTGLNASGGLVIILAFTDGTRLRVGAGEWVDVDRDDP